MNAIVIATDGSCIQQGGFRQGDETQRPGGSGFVARMPDGTVVRKATPFPDGTIGTMEIRGLRMGLEFAAAVADRTDERITIKCDSQFVVNGFNDWLAGWAAKGYHKKGGLTGADDWRAIDALKASLGDRVRVEWVRGHSGDPLNETCDALVNGCARSQKPHDDTHAVLGDDARTKRPSTTDLPDAADPPLSRTPQEPFADTDDSSPTKGLHAQAAVLLAKAAADPRMSALLAQGLGMALDERRLVARHSTDTLEAATLLRSVLERRGEER